MDTLFRQLMADAPEWSRQVSSCLQPDGSTGSRADSNWNVTARNVSQCGTCHQTMDIQTCTSTARTKTQLYCSTCTQGFSLPHKGLFSTLDTRCPLDGYQVIRVSSGNGYVGSGYNLCPNCYNADDGTKLPCFKCTESNCPLASPASVPVLTCSCGARRVLKQLPQGKWVVSCEGYPTCTLPTRWLPTGVLHATVTTQQCSSCTVPTFKLQFRFAPGSMPPHIMCQVPFIACCMCDAALQEGDNTASTTSRTHAARPTPLPNTMSNSVTSTAYPTTTASTAYSSTNTTASHSSSLQNSFQALQDGVSSPPCQCQCPSIELTVRQGPNAGRIFYKCGQENSPCTFFHFKDEGPLVNCLCSIPSRVFTAKQGSNQGRQFRKCSKREEACTFFEWIE